LRLHERGLGGLQRRLDLHAGNRPGDQWQHVQRAGSRRQHVQRRHRPELFATRALLRGLMLDRLRGGMPMIGAYPHATESPTIRGARHAAAACTGLLRVYAGCFFASSLLVGTLVLGATALAPQTGLLGALAVCSAIATAYALGLVSEATPPSIYAYSALFIGLGARSAFADPAAALALATLGGAATALLTAGMRGFLIRIGLPSLSLPFVAVYLCAISAGGALDASWAVTAPATTPDYLGFLPPLARLFLQALGAIVFLPRVEVGLVLLCALCVNARHAPLLALLGFAIALLVDLGLGLPPELRFASLVNAIFTSVGLGMAWYTPSPASYLRAAAGALFCVLLTLGLSEPLGRLGFIPLSFPFNLSVFAVLLIDRQRALLLRSGATFQAATAAREPAQIQRNV
jgi:urea transporter